MSRPSINPWKVLSTQSLHDYRIFQTREDRVLSPRTGQEHQIFIVDGPSWVNVLAFTPEKHLILVQQYRHGTRLVTLEIPGGMVDVGESPLVAGARELLEETGYQGTPPRLLGKVHPNPAFQTNTCYTILIEQAVKIQNPQLDEGEDISVHIVPEEEFASWIAQGKITHSLVAVADLWRRLWRAGNIQPTVI